MSFGVNTLLVGLPIRCLSKKGRGEGEGRGGKGREGKGKMSRLNRTMDGAQNDPLIDLV